MRAISIVLLTLLFSLSSPAMGENVHFRQSSLAAEGTVSAEIPANSTVGRVMGKLDQYPQVVDARTGGNIPFPSGVGNIVPQAQRVSWGATEWGILFPSGINAVIQPQMAVGKTMTSITFCPESMVAGMIFGILYPSNDKRIRNCSIRSGEILTVYE